jgi:hypothetical protein
VPLNVDINKYIKWPLPEPTRPFKKPMVLTERSFLALKDILNNANWGPGSDAKYHTISGRWTYNPEIPEYISQELLQLARDSWGEPDLKQSFIFAARYQKQGDIVPYLWEHLDDTSSQFMIDICITKNELDSWGVIVDGELFSEEENSAIFFNSQQQIHSRPEYPSSSDDSYLIAFFAVYTKPGDWAHEIDRESIDRESFIALAKDYVYDADIRFFSKRGYPMYFNDLPESNTLCLDCNECYVSDPTTLSELLNIDIK